MFTRTTASYACSPHPVLCGVVSRPVLVFRPVHPRKPSVLCPFPCFLPAQEEGEDGREEEEGDEEEEEEEEGEDRAQGQQGQEVHGRQRRGSLVRRPRSWDKRSRDKRSWDKRKGAPIDGKRCEQRGHGEALAISPLGGLRLLPLPSLPCPP